jgi:hypothetical protein
MFINSENLPIRKKNNWILLNSQKYPASELMGSEKIYINFDLLYALCTYTLCEIYRAGAI